MSSYDTIELPSYLDHSESIRDRITEIGAREVVLRVDALHRSYEAAAGQVTALRNINLQLRSREFVSIIGPSGCGKSTLIRILAGLDQPTTGQAALDGCAITAPGADRGMVFQNYTLFPWLTVKRNVMFGMRMKGIARRAAADKALEWLDLVGLASVADSYPSQLSGGMKQRVAIARALANEPRVLLMDEPFGALDAQTRASMQRLLLRIWQQVHVTIVFITHDLDEAVYLSDRIVVLGANPGRVLEEIHVPVSRPRAPSQFLTGHFLATKQRLEELIHQPDDEADALFSSNTKAHVRAA